MKVPSNEDNGEPRASKKIQPDAASRSSLARGSGPVLGGGPGVVFFPLSAGQKIWAGSAFLVLGDVAFWVAALALGREVIRRYRRFLDPRDWFGGGRG